MKFNTVSTSEKKIGSCLIKMVNKSFKHKNYTSFKVCALKTIQTPTNNSCY